MNRQQKGLQDDAGQYVDQAFGLKDLGTLGCGYLTKPACLQIGQKPFGTKPGAFIEEFTHRMLDQIGPWERDDFPKKMWKWRVKSGSGEKAKPSKKNNSLEVTLERAIFGAQSGDAITYQVAATSGYSGAFSSPRHAIDLVERHSPTGYEFIELKWPRSDKTPETPLSAAMELLRYFAAFVAAQNYLRASPVSLRDNHVLRAKQLKLKLTVLGPQRFYEGYELSKLQQFLDEGLKHYGKERDWELSFAFSAFDRDFEWCVGGDAEKALTAYNERSYLFGEAWPKR